MNCPNCNHPCGETDFFCSRCGSRLTGEAPQPPVYTSPAPKKGSHWVPIFLLIVMSVIGIAVYFVTRSVPDPEISVPSSSSIPWFTLEDGTLYFEAARYNGPAELTVPSEIDGEPVLEIGYGCFENCTGLTTVVLPDTLTGIGGEAFSGCTELRGVFIPESVAYIGGAAFANCSNLEAISIPASVTSVGYGAFEGCDNLWYIFYDGTHDAWTELYNEFITPYTGVFCEDGSFYHAIKPNN